MKTCYKCNTATIEDRAIFCPFCGQPYADVTISSTQQSSPVEQTAAPPIIVAPSQTQNNGAFQYISNRSKSKTLLLCIFLGIFGGHHFYAGNTRWGFIYLYTLGFFGVGVIVNLIQLLRDDYCDAAGKYIMV